MHMISAVGLCDGEDNLLQGNLTEVEVVDANKSLIQVLPRPRSRALKVVGRSLYFVATMKPPKDMVATFTLFASRKDGNQRSRKMISENKMLTCVIPDLQPNSTYNVTLKACTQEGVCKVYGESLSTRTRPSVPRHVTVSHRTNEAFRVFWVWSFEDVNGQYRYKVKAVEFGGSKVHTCESLPADNSSSSCLVANLTRGTKYKVAVSACTSDKYCSAYTRSVVGETLPNPPRNPSLVKASRTILTTKFLPPEDDKWPSFIYAGTYEAIGGVNFYRTGCATKNPMKRPYCEGHWLSPATKYNFRTFACTRKSFLCSEGQSTIVQTTEPKPNRIYVARLENGSAYASWRSTMRRTDDEQLDFRVNQPTEITQTTAFVNWTVLNGWYGYTNYGFVYALPVDEELGQQQCVGVDRNDCTLQNLRPNTEYSVVVKACYNLGYCAAPSQPMKFRTAKPASIVNKEIKSPQGHSIGGEIAEGVYEVGDWVLPDAKPTETILKLLNSLAKDIDQATITPADPTCQLMIRVAFSKLDVPEIGDMESVFVVITPVSGDSPPEGPTWKTRPSYPAELEKSSKVASGTYVDPTNGSWQVRLSMPQASLATKLPDEDVLIGSGLGNITDGYDFDGPLAPGTAFAILFRVYTNLGIGTTPSKILSTEGKQSKMRASGGLVAIAVIFTVLCGVLIGLFSVLVSILRSMMLEIPKGTKSELGKK
nr:unnamed protein product [Spirometra erinaceieuropaei]